MDDAKVSVVKIEDCIDEMLYDLENGKEKGTTTHIPELDNCWKWRKGEFNIWTGYANEGKALDIETIIPTPNGPTFMRDLNIGDEVFDENGIICNITNATEIMYDRECYKITFSDGVSVVADANHQWVVDDMQSRASKQRQVRRSTETKKRGTNQQSKCLTSQLKTTKELIENVKINNKGNYSIPLAGAAQYPKKDLIIDPYLLGAWLGDGSKDYGQITSADEEILQQFRDKGFIITKHQGKYAYGILKFKVLLRKVGVLKNKHVPWEYLHSSRVDRLNLLKGLMDTDGFTDDLGRCEYTCTDWHLAEHVRTLIESLGIKVYFTEDEAKLNGRVIGPRFRFRFKTTTVVFRLKRKAERQIAAKPPKNECRIIISIEKVESRPVKCIEVNSPSHMYLCTEHYIPTHNSLFIRYLCIIKSIMDGWRFIFCAPEDFPPKEFFDDMIHMVTGISTDRDNTVTLKKEFYLNAYNLLRDRFVFVYIKPPQNTIKGVLVEFEKVMADFKADGVIIDPLVKFARPKDMSDRDDIYAAYITSLLTDFSREHNISVNLVMHQLTPRMLENGYYPKPSMYNIKGGGSWSDSTDNVLALWRPLYAKDKINDEVMFTSHKIKKQKLVGLPQDFKMRFDRRSNRYISTTGKDLFKFDDLVY